jgi:hypothetical protein
MLLSAYMLSYGNWTVIPSHWEKVFAEMKELGFDAVDLSFSESEKRYSMRAIEGQIEAAHRQGLKVFLIPSRIAGRLAGAPSMCGYFLAENHHLQLPEYPMLGCVDSPELLKWSEDFIRDMVNSFDIDGIIWDEPKGADVISTHLDTLKRYHGETGCEQARQSLIDYITNLTNVAKKIRPDLSFTIFNMPVTSKEFTAASARIPGIDYAGFDGVCCLQSFFKEAPRKSKATIRETWERTKAETNGVCGTFALIENILTPKEQIEEYTKELKLTLENVQPDHLACYYYGHNNESAELIQSITMKEICKMKKQIVNQQHKKEIYYETAVN